MNTVQYADVETSSEDYATRFTGPAGRWLLSVQTRLFLEHLTAVAPGPHDEISLLDVGGGHGQIAEAISESGFRSRCNVTVLGSADSCRDRLAPFLASGLCSFTTGDLLKLPFPDRSFDVATSFRFIPHCDDWKRHIAELCRVARRAVIADYPTYISVNCLSPLLFHLKKGIEKNTRTYTLFSNSEISAAFESSNFKIAARTGEFFLPMVIHRLLKRPAASAALEYPFAATGISNLLGSPMIVRAVPQGV